MEFSGLKVQKYYPDSLKIYSNSMTALIFISNMLGLKDLQIFDITNKEHSQPYILGTSTKNISHIKKGAFCHIQPYDNSKIMDKIFIHWIDPEILELNPEADIYSDEEYVNNMVFSFSLLLNKLDDY